MFTTPLLPVYFHLLPVALLGKSVEVARGTTALFAVLGAVALPLALRDPFRTRWWWTAPLSWPPRRGGSTSRGRPSRRW